MEFFKVLENRKSVRSYKANKKITAGDIRKILKYVNIAPSARNLQSYKVYVANGRKKVAGLFPVFFNQRSDFISSASVIMVFCADPVTCAKVFGERGKSLYAIQDATIAATFAQLCATALGFSTCWVGNFDTEKMQKALNTKLIPIASIIIGYSDEKPERNPRKPLNLISQII